MINYCRRILGKKEAKMIEEKGIKNKYIRRSALLLFDILLIFISYLVANLFLNNVIGFDFKFLFTTGVAIVVYVTVFLIFRVYRSITEYTGAKEYSQYLGLSLFSCAIVILTSYVSKFEMLGKRENILASCFVIGFMIFSRVLYRKIVNSINNIRARKLRENEIKNVLVIGAGAAGLQVVRDELPKMGKNYRIVGIIDDSISKRHSVIHGIEIVGGREKIIEVCEKEKVDLILFAIANISKEQKTKVLNICSKTKAKIKVLPNLREFLLSDVQVKMHNFRDMQIEDLLGREPIQLENDNIKSFIKDKVVLVTGGGGSIGSELCRQIASFGAKKLLMIDIYENTLYETELEIRKKYPKLNLTAIIASVRDEKRINEIFEKYHPELVFHAAAHKHVPLMETSPIEAIKNNVFGTYNVARAASKYEVDKFILVSTDKAVNPTSVMGATKRICEMIIQIQNARSKTNFVAVRFGNVLGSHGSVIPIFKKQIEQGGPVTVTHREITRFFMTIPEAVGLILQSMTFADGGEIFVLDMGEPVKIYDLAEKMIRLSGYVPNEDIKIEITGLRPGEKLYEELLVSEEGLSKTLHDKIMVTKIMDFDEAKVEGDLNLLQDTVMSDEVIDNAKVRDVIKTIVPSFIDKYKGEKED